MMERRGLYWEFRQLAHHWSVGSVLFLEVQADEPRGEMAEISLQWSFRRPGPPPFDKPEIIASGKLPLPFKRVEKEWKVSHIEKLIAALHEAVAMKQ